MNILDKLRLASTLRLVFTGFNGFLPNSTPGSSTRETLYFKGFYDFNKNQMGEASLKASDKTTEKSGKMGSLHIPARVVYPKKKSADQRLYIKYYPFCVSKNKHIIKRIYKLPKHSNPREEKRLRDEYCKVLDELVLEGFVVDEKEKKDKVQMSSISVVMKEYLATRNHLKKRTIESIEGALRKFKVYLQESRHLFKGPKEFTSNDALKYRNHLIKLGLGNRTINNNISAIRTFFNETISLYPELIRENPFNGLKKLNESGGRNTAFLPAQVKQITELQKNYPDLDFLAKFMYYTLMRSNEMSKLQVKHIGMYHPNQIYVTPEMSKNSHGRHVVISNQLEELLQQYNIRSYPPDFYVFGFEQSKGHNVRGKFTPTKKPTNRRYLGSKYRKTILSQLGFSSDYTLYSWKHTGVVNAKLAGISDADIMQQTGHRAYDSYQKYLKSLGLFVTGEYASKIPTI